MAIKPWLERRANAEIGPRDGKAEVLERLPFDRGLAVADVVVAPAPVEDHATSRRDEVHGVIADKVLHAFVRNRLQISFPLSLNVSRLAPPDRDLLMETAILAARSAGSDRRPNLEEALGNTHLAEGDLRRLEELQQQSEKPLITHCEAVRASGYAPHAFAVATMALPRPDACEQAFLAYLAELLHLRQDVVVGITRRYRR